jgi:large subunit ribosomal protein L22
MKGYSNLPKDTENCAMARVEGVNASYKDLSEVCGRIRNKKTDWAIGFLEKAAEGEIPVLFKRHNKNLGHRRELGGRKGRYPRKAAAMVLKALKSAMANGRTQGMGDIYTIVAASANKKATYPRMAPKGRMARSYLETARIEIIVKGSEVPKGVTVTPPKKPDARAAEKKAGGRKAEKKEESRKDEAPTAGKEPAEPPKLLKEEGKQVHEHRHEVEGQKEAEKKPEGPHPHGEHNKR